jgi:hypothetical protein
MRQLNHGRVFPAFRSAALFVAARSFHLGVGELGEFTRPRTAGAIGHDDARERPLPAQARGDARISHDLDVILMRRDAKMRGARQGRGERTAIRHINVSIGRREFHQALK